jgi:hypothetical protein
MKKKKNTAEQFNEQFAAAKKRSEATGDRKPLANLLLAIEAESVSREIDIEGNRVIYKFVDKSEFVLDRDQLAKAVKK